MNMGTPRISFMIGGAQKCGTTALAEYLRAHPRVRLPLGKEAHVFDAPDYDDAALPEAIDARFAAHFAEPWQDSLVYGDATPISLFLETAIQRAARYNPALRWIILLRDPAARAISQHAMEHARGTESLPLLRALLAERRRLRRARGDLGWNSSLRNHSYRARGEYAAQLQRLLHHFPREQVLLLRSVDLAQDAAATLREVYAYLGLAEPLRMPETLRHFEGSYGHHALGHAMLGWWSWQQRRKLRRALSIDLRT
jgi:hypothetical protein